MTSISGYSNWKAHVAVLPTKVFFGVLQKEIVRASVYTQPIFAGAVAVLVMHEQLTLQKIIAATLIVCGVLLVNKRSR